VHSVFVTISLVQEAGPASNGHVPTNPGENDYGKSLAEAANGNSGQNSSSGYHAQVQDPNHKATADAKAAEEWATHEAPNGKPFYHNLITGTTQWEKPAALETHNHAQVMHKQVEVSCFTLACLYELHMIEHCDCANQLARILKDLSG
jgi:hypothetical protein